MPKALIAGCGIAGPITAIALQKAGIESEIFESYAKSADAAGAFLTLAPNGIAALGVLGLDRTVHDISFPIERMIFRNGSGRLLGEIATGAAAAGTALYNVKRADLYRALRDEAAGRGVEIRYGKQLSSVSRANNDRVVATFSDGSSAAGELLIGCDGVHSIVRRVVDPAAPAARYQPLLNVGGYARGVNNLGGAATFYMCFGARAFFGYAPAPDGSIYWFANLPTPEEPSREILANIDSIEGKRRLLDLFWKDKIPAIEIIEATTDLRAPLPTYVLSSVPKLNRDRVVLLGDAAHAMSPSSGQGASMAIEDAVILAKCLRDLPVERALERYEALRRDRVERVAAYGERSSAGKAAGPVGRVLRDLALPFVLRYLAAPGRLAWMYDYRIDWNEHESSSASAPRTVPALR